MNDFERLNELLRGYGEMVGQTLSVDEGDACAFRFGASEELGHFRYLPDSGCVVLWATVGFLAPDRYAPLRVVRLLQLQDLGCEADGFTLGAERGTGRVVIAARRAVEDVADAVALAGWVDRLAASVEAVKTSIEEDLPVETGDVNLAETEFGDEDDNRLAAVVAADGEGA